MSTQGFGSARLRLLDDAVLLSKLATSTTPPVVSVKTSDQPSAGSGKLSAAP